MILIKIKLNFTNLKVICNVSNDIGRPIHHTKRIMKLLNVYVVAAFLHTQSKLLALLC